MKWVALFWVYRRESLSGWRRGWRRAGAPILTRDEARATLNLPPLGELEKQTVQDAVDSRLRLFTAAAGKPALPGWVERPLEVPEWSEENIRRFYKDWFRGRG